MSKANDLLEGLSEEIKKLEAEVERLTQFNPETVLSAFGDDNRELRRELSRAATLLADAEDDRDENYANWMDCKQKALHKQVTIDELSAENAKLHHAFTATLARLSAANEAAGGGYIDVRFEDELRELGIEVNE